jgi:hypothetical protein
MNSSHLFGLLSLFWSFIINSVCCCQFGLLSSILIVSSSTTGINMSLSALGDVIGCLSSGEKFVPYRNNKLTMLLQVLLPHHLPSRTLSSPSLPLPVLRTVSEATLKLSCSSTCRRQSTTRMKQPTRSRKLCAHRRTRVYLNTFMLVVRLFDGMMIGTVSA